MARQDGGDTINVTGQVRQRIAFGYLRDSGHRVLPSPKVRFRLRLSFRHCRFTLRPTCSRYRSPPSHVSPTSTRPPSSSRSSRGGDNSFCHPRRADISIVSPAPRRSSSDPSPADKIDTRKSRSRLYPSLDRTEHVPSHSECTPHFPTFAFLGVVVGTEVDFGTSFDILYVYVFASFGE